MKRLVPSLLLGVVTFIVGYATSTLTKVVCTRGDPSAEFSRMRDRANAEAQRALRRCCTERRHGPSNFFLQR